MPTRLGPMADRALSTCCCASNKRAVLRSLSATSRGSLPQPGARRFEVGTRASHQPPERRRVIHPLQMHQLVDHHVVADRVRHLHEPPVEADAALPRARAPSPALIADADTLDLEAVPRGELAEPRRQLAPRPIAELAFGFGRQRRDRPPQTVAFALTPLLLNPQRFPARRTPRRRASSPSAERSHARCHRRPPAAGSASREDDARRRSQVQMAATVV